MQISVAAVSVYTVPMGWTHNEKVVTEGLRRAREGGASLVLFPELCLTGYGCEDRFASADLQDRAAMLLSRILPHTQGLIAAVGLPVRHRGVLFNCVALCCDGTLCGIVPKQHLPNDGVHYEQRYFHEWPRGVVESVELPSIPGAVPMGDLIFSISGVRVGFEICEDAWVSERPGAWLSRRGAEIILNPSASHFALRKHDIRRRFVLEGSRAFACGYVYTNLLGCEAGRIVYDGGAFIAQAGTMRVEGTRLALDDCSVTIGTLDLDVIRLQRQRNVSSGLVFDSDHSTRKVSFSFAPASNPPGAASAVASRWEQSADLELEEFTRAVTRGLYDYLRKTRAKGCVISLSGGADSSATAILVSTLCERILKELPRDALLRELSFIEDLSAVSDAPSLCRKLCCCIYTRTKNSSVETETAARTLAEEIGAEFHAGAVDSIIESGVALVSGWLGRQLPWNSEHWGKDDLTLQNVQARARAIIAWLVANERSALLLTTSNRSEAAVGYCTMDGDTAGGFNLIGGIAKSFLWRWLDWMHREGPDSLSPVKSVSLVLAQKAKAELRPPSCHQTDEDDLGPYAVRDALETHAIQHWRSPLASLQLLATEFQGRYTVEQLARWVELFYRLWSRNQWKRERFSPFFHLDDRNLDPRTWCRFPILSGGFEEEIKEMWEWVKNL